MLRYCLAAMLFFMCFHASAYTVYVTVKNTYTNEPIEDVRVEIHNHRKLMRSAKTDSNGVIKFKRIHRPIIYVHVIDDSGRFDSIQHFHSHCGFDDFRFNTELTPTPSYRKQLLLEQDTVYGTWIEACKLQYKDYHRSDHSYMNEYLLGGFPGGHSDLRNYLRRNARLSDKLWMEKRVQARVNFVVEADGKLTHIHIVEADDPEIAEELMRLFWRMPDWDLDTLDDVPIRSVKSVRVIYELYGP